MNFVWAFVVGGLICVVGQLLMDYTGKMCIRDSVQGVLAGLQHAGQPVHRGVRVRIAHGLVQRGDEVVMLFAVFIVQQRFFGDTLLHQRPFHHGFVPFAPAVEHRHFQRVQRRAAVAVDASG